MIEVLMAMALLGVLSMFFASLMTASTRMSSQMATNSVVDSLKYTMTEILRHPVGVANTIRASRGSSGALRCFGSPSDDIPNPPGSELPEDPPRMIHCTDGPHHGTLSVRKSDNSIYWPYDGENGTAGFNMLGYPCTGFNDTTGNDMCPMRWDLYIWIIGCTGGVCKCGDMNVEFKGEFKYRPQSDEKKFAFDYNRRYLKVFFPMRNICKGSSNTY